MLSVSSGYDWRYLTREVAVGRENYYLRGVELGGPELGGEPPGVWAGRGLEAVGLVAGEQVSAEAMEALYGEFTVPGTGEVLGRAPMQFASVGERVAAALAAEPEADEARQAAIALEVRKSQRAAVHFFDATFSPAKSVSVLWASACRSAVESGEAATAAAAAGEVTESVRLRGVEAEWQGVAGHVWAAVEAGNTAMLEFMADEAGYSRVGFHGKDADGAPVGRWADAHEWIVGKFRHHTSREGDPQLHVHNTILNRVQCADGKWRTLDGRAVFRARAAGGAIGERVMENHLTRALGVEWAMRPDGRAREIVGIPEEAREAFSTRRAAISRKVAELAAEYKAAYGHAPDAHALSKISQFATLDTRPPKSRDVPTRLEQLAAWEAQHEAAAGARLAPLAARAVGRVDVSVLPGMGVDGAAVGVAVIEGPAGGPGLDAWPPAAGERLFDPGAVMAAVMAAAVHEAAAAKSVWSRSDLMRALNAALPDCLAGLDDASVRGLLEDLADTVCAGGHGAIRLDPPAAVPVPEALQLADGASVFAPARGAKFAAVAALAQEEALLAGTARPGAPGMDAAQVEQALVGLGARGVSLGEDQAAAVRGILSSGRGVEVLIGPAGTGKSHTLGALRQVWEAECGPVLGLAVAQTAVDVLTGEGITDTRNTHRFLDDYERGRLRLTAGQLVIVDEAGMAPTVQLAAIEEITRTAGAKLLLVGDDRQLGAVGAGGALRLLTHDLAHEPAAPAAAVSGPGLYELSTVHRFHAPWEREASLRLRAGDAGVLAVYDRHGRLVEGDRDAMSAAARQGWLADHLAGRRALLTVSTNEAAAVLSAAVREDLVTLGRVEPGGVTLGHKDGAGTRAGVGDLIATRANDRALTEPVNQDGTGGHFVTNRDVWQVAARHGDGALTVRRQVPAGGWGEPVTLPAAYVAEHVTLAYAGTVHAAQGRTVDTSHAVVDSRTDAAALYVQATRGRDTNVLYCVTAETDESALDAPAPGAEVNRAAALKLDRFTLLAGILEAGEPERAATEVLRTELAGAERLDRLTPIWTAVLDTHAAARHEALLRTRLGPVLDEHQVAAVLTDDAAGTLGRLLATVEAAGHDPADLLARAAGSARGFGDADSIAAVLHYRVERLAEAAGGLAPTPGRSFTAQTPDAGTWPGEVGDFARGLAQVMDARVRVLGEAQALDPSLWALARLGPVPTDPDQAGEWMRRAGAVAAYREAYGHTYGAGTDASRLGQADAIGAAPPGGALHARTAWHTAHAALDPAGTQLVHAAMTEAQLRARLAAYTRAEAWAPPSVAVELRQANLDARTMTEQATLARAGGDTAAADRWDTLAEAAEARRRELTEADAARAAWEAQTAAVRAEAAAARTELAARGLTGTGAEQQPQDVPVEAQQLVVEPAAAPVELTAAQRERWKELNARGLAAWRSRDAEAEAAARAERNAYAAELGPERVELLRQEAAARREAAAQALRAEQRRAASRAQVEAAWVGRPYGPRGDQELVAAAAKAQADRLQALAAAEHARAQLAEQQAAVAAGRGPRLVEAQARLEAAHRAEQLAAQARDLNDRAREARDAEVRARIAESARRREAEATPFYRPGLRGQLTSEAQAWAEARQTAQAQAQDLSRRLDELRPALDQLHRNTGRPWTHTAPMPSAEEATRRLETGHRSDHDNLDRLRHRIQARTTAAETAASQRADLLIEQHLRAEMPHGQTIAETNVRIDRNLEAIEAAKATKARDLEHDYSYDHHHSYDRGIDREGPSLGI